ncbi:MAG: twin-arginine translocase TatA/TatE family subunit [Chloroflexi bacterium]|nr:twin-arginine translocase TatA/TatE family subunit [Chloroflexota bacterium]
MSILGMGSLEILVVLLLAFIILGPERMVDVARKLGKLTRELRRMTNEVTVMVQEEVDRVKDPIIREGKELESRVTSVTSELNVNGPEEAKSEAEDAADGPVSFKSAKQAKAEKRQTEKAEAEEETPRETERRP